MKLHAPTPFLRFSGPDRLVAPLILAVLLLIPAFSAGATPSELRPSRPSLRSQHRSAKAHDFTFLRNPAQVRSFVSRGWLVPVPRGRNYELVDVSFPYARPEVLTFIERLSGQYRRACGELLVVTSLTRPRTHQPRNSSPLSVHPTGMALDLRRSKNRRCRSWLEDTLAYLENQGTLEASRERWPPHYHVAVFPSAYRRYVERRARSQVSTRKASSQYRVRPGDNLWKIARRHGTTVREIRHLNGLRTSTIRPGQLLKVP